MLIGPERELEAALRTALAPWGLHVRSLESPRVALALPAGDAQARTLARDLNADALIWIRPGKQGRALCLYDATSGTSSERRLPEKPLDARVSAALALSVKTALRSKPSATAADPAATSAPARNARFDGVDGGPIAPSRAGTGVEALNAAGPPPHSTVQLVLAAALRASALSTRQSEARYALELRVSPWAHASGTESVLWIATELELGSATDVAGATFRGQYSQLGAGLALGFSRAAGRYFAWGAELGLSLDHGTLSGTLSSDETRASQSRFGASVHLGPEAAWAFGPCALLLQPGVGVALRRQRYHADDAVVLETEQLSWRLGAGVRLNME